MASHRPQCEPCLVLLYIHTGYSVNHALLYIHPHRPKCDTENRRAHQLYMAVMISAVSQCVVA